jgi:serine/threonine kinase 16
MCILGGDWRFPDEGAGGKKKTRNQTGQSEDSEISDSIREVVRKCLAVEPSQRPDIDELIDIVSRVVEELPRDGAP